MLASMHALIGCKLHLCSNISIKYRFWGKIRKNRRRDGDAGKRYECWGTQKTKRCERRQKARYRVKTQPFHDAPRTTLKLCNHPPRIHHKLCTICNTLPLSTPASCLILKQCMLCCKPCHTMTQHAQPPKRTTTTQTQSPTTNSPQIMHHPFFTPAVHWYISYCTTLSYTNNRMYT